ncbi:hypothetical protein Q5752_001096 [Cryptotrichosporon argae]
MSHSNDSDLLWLPKDVGGTQAVEFRKRINEKYGIALGTYEDLWKWSVDHRADFWGEVWDWEAVLGDRGSCFVVDESKSPADNPAWFTGARLNWAENQLRHHRERPGDVAIIDFSEPCAGWDAPIRKITQAELYSLVERTQAALVKAGLLRGHRVAYWGGNRAEAAVVLLATSAIGAIFSSVAADFGVGGVIERLEQIKPKLLFVSNGVVYHAQPRPLLPLLPRLLAALHNPPSCTIVIEHLPVSLAADLSLDRAWKQARNWDDFLGTDHPATDVSFARIGFNEPIWVLFSSGTTGKPKAIVHRQGGQLLDSLREHHLAGDMTHGDVHLFYTTPGWMMFQYLVSGLATGATIVMYEGSPLKRPEYLWEKIDELGVTVFGASAKYIEQISKVYPDVGRKHRLSSLRQILSTGSPLPPQLFDFVYRNIKKDVLLGSITGGTDICSVFAGRNTSLPVYRGEIQSRMLGYDLATHNGPDQAGELVVLRAFPAEPIGFWPLKVDALPDGHLFSKADEAKARERFIDSYFKGAQGIWCTRHCTPCTMLTPDHGDHVMITKSRSGNGGGLVMLGRSDGVLNPAGIRFGPADIYTVVESPDFVQLGIEETLVTAIEVDGGSDERVVLFVKMAPGFALSADFVKTIKDAIKTARSARHVPSAIVVVSDVPITLTGKKIEVQIKKVINGGAVAAINPDTLRNPECLAEYVERGLELRGEFNGRKAAL